jgi:type I restriction enzyme S subunit
VIGKFTYPVIGGNGRMGYTDMSNNMTETIVVGRVGALCGNVHLINGPTWVTDNALRINHFREFDPKYLASLLRAMNLNRFANANAQPLLTGDIVKSQKVVKPSIDEQIDLVDKIEGKIQGFNSAILASERKITLLQEYRVRLIADVVTGKLDVREVAAGLPDESDQLELTADSDTVSDEDIDAETEPEDTMPEAQDED